MAKNKAPRAKRVPGAKRTVTYTVHGTVTGEHGKPIAKADVVVSWQRIRDRRRLGNARTSSDGEYRISYHPPKHAAGKTLIVVEAHSRRLESPLESAVTIAQADLTLDLASEPRDSSEYATLLREVRPLLEKLTLNDLVESEDYHDISFLAQETGKTKEQIACLTIAARLEEAYDLPAAVFFAFFRLRSPSSLPSPLIDAIASFTPIEGLVRRIGSLIFALSTPLQAAALQAAVKQNIIGSRYARAIPDLVSRLQKHRTTDLLAQPYLVGKASLGQLLTLAAIPAGKQDSFATALSQNTQSMTRFWVTLRDGKHGFTADEATTIERTLSIGVLVKNHVPLLQLVLQRFATGASTRLSDLARLSLQEWESLVDKVGAPPSIDAVAGATTAEVFARAVYARVTRAFPTPALASRVASGNLVPRSEQAPLDRFFANNGDLNLLRHNLSSYLSQEGEKAFAGIEAADRARVIANARRMQRVLFVAPEVDAAETLLSMGIHSATDVAMMGRQQFFLRGTQAGITKREANRIYSAAAQRYAGVVALYTQLNRDAIGVWPNAIGDVSALDAPISNAVARDQSLSTLFGSQDYCAVESCTSILSPAAYLCDLLYWLRFRITGAQSALDVLNTRRTDIGNLKLNCPNTDTPLPYVDLVNEILGDAISVPNDPNSTINPLWKQTSEGKTRADLRAAPEYFNRDAYVALFDASYPHSLPYSEGLDELRTYLQAAGIPLWQLRRVLLPLHGATTADLVAVAGERFTMAPHAIELITSPNFVTAAVAWHTATPPTDLPPVSAFTHAAAITYDQLLELLASVWVQNGLGIAIQGIDDTCDTSIQSLAPAPLDVGFLDRAHRFLRLWRETGYQMWELDLLVRSTAVVNGALDPTGLVALGTFRMLQDQTKLAVDAQLAWFQRMDTGVHRAPDDAKTTSLYSRVFLNPAIVSLHPDPDLAAVASGAALGDANLSHHLDAIQASLGLSGTDGSALVALFGLDAANSLTLDNLTLMYRVSQLANVAGLSIADLKTVALMITPGAANAAAAITAAFTSLSATTTYLQQIKAIRQSGFSIEALSYLVTPPAAAPPYWPGGTALTDAGIATALTAVRQAILNPSGGDVNGSVIAAVASQLGLANDVTAFVTQNVDLPGSALTLLAVLTDATLTNPPGGPYPGLTRANYPDQFVAMQLLDKIRVIVLRLHLVNADLSWLVNNAAVYGGIDFAQLPVLSAQAALGSAPLVTMVLLVTLARLFTSAPVGAPIQTLFDLLTGVQAGTLVNEASTQAALSTITGWALADIVSLCAALGVTFSADYLMPSTFDLLRTLEAMIAATSGKASGAQLVEWAAVPADETTAETAAGSALSVLKARYSNPDWLAAAPAVMDPIREHRSAALQDYLVGNGDHAGHSFADVNALFDYFLIDTQMSSCEVTTRVVQAYIAVQIFVERCRMNLEAPGVQIDPLDDAWGWWSRMKRYRIWQAAREVFLYPENWLVESQRPSRTEIFKKLEQDVHQNEHTADYLESVTLSYIDRLDEIAHLLVTGTCSDSLTGDIHVVARTLAEPPRFYHRSLADGAWTGWQQIPLDIKAHQVVPTVYRRRLCIFWPDVKVSNEPRQNLPAAQQSTNPPSQEVAKYVSIGLDFSVFRNGAWAPAQKAKGKLFDIPLLTSQTVSDSKSVEALYTLKAQSLTPNLFVDVFRLGAYDVFALPLPIVDGSGNITWETLTLPINIRTTVAVQLGRATFDGRFNDLELRNLGIPGVNMGGLLSHAQSAYGPDAQLLLPLSAPDPDLVAEPSLVPMAGALATLPADVSQGANQTLPLNFTGVALEVNAGPLLDTASVPFRVVGPDSDVNFDPTSHFFYQDSRRCYYVESQKFYWTGSIWSPNPPSNPDTAPFEERYFFHRFYHPYTRLFWHQLAGDGFTKLYDRDLQLNPDQVDPSHADVFSFQTTYHPIIPRVSWGEDNEILDFSPNAAYSVYNWELFLHTPFYIAQLLSQNQKFEESQRWFHYIFDPTRQSADPAPKRFWIPKPLYNITSSEILSERINNLLRLVNLGDPDAVNQVKRWQNDPFNPFLLADLRPVAYMKAVVMGYLDNLIAWADNLFATDSREALSEATLLYVIAAEMLGPRPAAITPAQHADDSYNELAPKLDAFANAMVDIENAMGSGGGGGGGGGGGDGMPGPQTFYFKIPPNDKLLGYWKTVGDRLFKLRHCQNIKGVTRQLALFDAPIDPGLLIKASAAGVDIGSVLNDVQAALPNYRFTALYSQASDFVNAVRAYGGSVLGAIEKSDGAALAVLQQTIQQQLQRDTDQIFQWQMEKAQHDIDGFNQTLALAQSKFDFNNSQDFANPAEIVGTTLHAVSGVLKVIGAATQTVGAVAAVIPNFTVGVAGFGGSPVATVNDGGVHAAVAGHLAGVSISGYGDIAEIGAGLSNTIGSWLHRRDGWVQAAKEAQIAIQQATIQLAGAELALAIAQQNLDNHQKQIDYLQKQIDFLTDKFTNQDLYDWMLGQLADTYFQSYSLAYKLCKQVERCYQYELGISDSNFIQFGYWDSLRKGLLAGETLNHDLRRMQASYLDKNSRRFEISRFISLAGLNPNALVQLLQNGNCDFDVPESLFDHDYPGHYNRHLVRVSVTVAYPNPGKFDNVKATLTMTSNKVRTSTDLTGGYAEAPPGTDPRFAYNYAAVPQEIVLGNAQDDPGLFQTSLSSNLSDQRYLPFEGGGAVGSWHFELPAASNEIAVARVTDVILHIYYTALDGGDAFKQGVLNG